MLGFRFALTCVLVAASTCSIICGSAGCDFLVPGECFGAGGIFGPCVDHGCVDGLVCFSGLAGDICVRPDKESWLPEDEACRVTSIGGTGVECLNFGQGCLPTCDNDGQCQNGTVCEEIIGACMHPSKPTHVQPPPGAELGPCDPNLRTGCGYHLDTCLDVEEGSICLQKDHPEWLVPCSKEDTTCPNGQVCAAGDGVCVWPRMMPAAGNSGGPCVGDDRLCFNPNDTCYVSLMLDVDAHICSNVDGLDLTECATDQDCMAGQGCAPEFSACVWLVP